ncbi:hypothetical protein HMPREF0198_0363 [Cardiobacterium hominis ATCC 15826]|uniref:Uncharacterized protein n=1 Tax=Cardiobacterium hominis (strain ATCC 15826 / DSM 8339 / NCTC 10426 / 6573) TaxID=638300 RepID=C8N786_CARH6|nr:hypothetical protein HMPREF0198_0363 [Cardiobacterium hominis ATCC 15826]
MALFFGFFSKGAGGLREKCNIRKAPFFEGLSFCYKWIFEITKKCNIL